MAMEIIDNFAMSGKKFLDDRQKWGTLAELQSNTDILMPKGFLAFIAEENAWYQMDTTDEGDPTKYTWNPFSGGSGQTIQLNSLPEITEDNKDEYAGKVFQYVGATTSDYTHGWFYQVVSEGDVDSVSYSWSNVPVQECSGQVIQYGSIGNPVPEADSSILGKIIQYIGVTNDNFSTGFFYKCSQVPETDDEPEYEWKQIDVQAAGEEKGAVLKSSLTTSVAVGGIEKGTDFEEETPLEALLRKMLTPMTAPTYTFTATPVGGLKKKDSVVTAPVFTLSIIALGANTERSYKILKDDEEVVSSTEITTIKSYIESMIDNVTEDITFTCVITYSDGSETKTVKSEIKYEFVNPLFYGIVNSANPEADEIAALTERLSKTAPFTWDNITMTNKFLCYAYPATMADLKDVRDGNNFGVLSSYAKSTAEINGISYKVYTTKESSSLNKGKMIFS